MKKAISLLSLVLLFSTPSLAQIFYTVNSTADTGDNLLGDGVCNTGDLNSENETECTLRAALDELENTSDIVFNSITFDIPESDPNEDMGIWTIAPSSLYPTINFPFNLDGTSQLGASCGDLSEGTPHNLNIKIDGSDTVSGDGFVLTGNLIQSIFGLSIVGFGLDGISIAGDANKTVSCNYIGVEPDGETRLSNGRGGVRLENFAAGSIIDDNLLSGNTSAGILSRVSQVGDEVYIFGNIIGLNASGTASISNGAGISMFGTSDLRIGQNNNGGFEKNTISGNTGVGIAFGATGGSSDNLIVGNMIGVSPDGLSLFGNGSHGIALGNTHNENQIRDNIIAGNGGRGITLNASNQNTIEGNTIGERLDGSPGGNFSDGIYIGIIGSNNAIQFNTISNNSGAGIFLFRDSNPTGWTFGNTVSQNSIYLNSGLGIEIGPEGLNPIDVDDADEGPNNEQNSPEISMIDAGSFLQGNNITFTYSVDSDPSNSVYPLTVEFFLSDSSGDEGETFLGSDTYTETDHNSLLAGEKTVTFGIGLNVEPTDFIGATATDAEGNTSEFSITPADVSLPVELSTFTAEIVNDQIQLQWTTLTETGNAGFEIQIGNGIVWTQIGFVQGQGDSEIESNYSFSSSDYSVHDTFLRLKQIDFDGEFSYSRIVELKHDIPIAGVLSEAYPNPTVGQSTLKFSSGSNGTVKARLFDVTGNEIAVVLNENILRGESREMSIDLSMLSQGVYFVQVESQNGSFTRKISVMR